MKKFNFLENISDEKDFEIFEKVLEDKNVRIERIVSFGQTSPSNYWYDQDENEFVIVLEGEGRILFENKKEISLKKGDSIFIEAHKKHRVTFTENKTIWFALFY
ncbi:cupin domain-containing protein [Thiovulum sp. ES]|nr:cupin domain-containing protein [Thiovulum sp. ES]